MTRKRLVIIPVFYSSRYHIQIRLLFFVFLFLPVVITFRNTDPNFIRPPPYPHPHSSKFHPPPPSVYHVKRHPSQHSNQISRYHHHPPIRGSLMQMQTGPQQAQDHRNFHPSPQMVWNFPWDPHHHHQHRGNSVTLPLPMPRYIQNNNNHHHPPPPPPSPFPPVTASLKAMNDGRIHQVQQPHPSIPSSGVISPDASSSYMELQDKRDQGMMKHSSLSSSSSWSIRSPRGGIVEDDVPFLTSRFNNSSSNSRNTKQSQDASSSSSLHNPFGLSSISSRDSFKNETDKRNEFLASPQQIEDKVDSLDNGWIGLHRPWLGNQQWERSRNESTTTTIISTSSPALHPATDFKEAVKKERKNMKDPDGKNSQNEFNANMNMTKEEKTKGSMYSSPMVSELKHIYGDSLKHQYKKGFEKYKHEITKSTKSKPKIRNGDNAKMNDTTSTRNSHMLEKMKRRGRITKAPSIIINNNNSTISSYPSVKHIGTEEKRKKNLGSHEMRSALFNGTTTTIRDYSPLTQKTDSASKIPGVTDPPARILIRNSRKPEVPDHNMTSPLKTSDSITGETRNAPITKIKFTPSMKTVEEPKPSPEQILQFTPNDIRPSLPVYQMDNIVGPTSPQKKQEFSMGSSSSSSAPIPTYSSFSSSSLPLSSRNPYTTVYSTSFPIINPTMMMLNPSSQPHPSMSMRVVPPPIIRGVKRINKGKSRQLHHHYPPHQRRTKIMHAVGITSTPLHQQGPFLRPRRMTSVPDPIPTPLDISQFQFSSRSLNNDNKEKSRGNKNHFSKIVKKSGAAMGTSNWLPKFRIGMEDDEEEEEEESEETIGMNAITDNEGHPIVDPQHPIVQNALNPLGNPAKTTPEQIIKKKTQILDPSSLVPMDKTIVVIFLMLGWILTFSLLFTYKKFWGKKGARMDDESDGDIGYKPLLLNIPKDGTNPFVSSRSLDVGTNWNYGFVKVLDFIDTARKNYEGFDWQNLDCQKRTLCELSQDRTVTGETGRKLTNNYLLKMVDVLNGIPMPQVIQAYLSEYKDAISQGKNAKKTCGEIYPSCKFSITKLIQEMKSKQE